jgi:hypothetical protein
MTLREGHGLPPVLSAIRLLDHPLDRCLVLGPISSAALVHRPSSGTVTRA